MQLSTDYHTSTKGVLDICPGFSPISEVSWGGRLKWTMRDS